MWGNLHLICLLESHLAQIFLSPHVADSLRLYHTQIDRAETDLTRLGAKIEKSYGYRIVIQRFDIDDLLFGREES